VVNTLSSASVLIVLTLPAKSTVEALDVDPSVIMVVLTGEQRDACDVLYCTVKSNKSFLLTRTTTVSLAGHSEMEIHHTVNKGEIPVIIVSCFQDQPVSLRERECIH
jgi:hypothetical protein